MSYLQTSKNRKKNVAAEMFKRVTSKDIQKKQTGIRSSYPLQLIMEDVMDIGIKSGRMNGGYQYFSIIIDVFSRYVWCVKMKNKSELPKTLEIIFDSMYKDFKKYPERIYADNEYQNNSKIQKIFKNRNIAAGYSLPQELSKAPKGMTAMVERVIGTLKRMIGLWTVKHGNNFHNDIQTIVNHYNSTFQHSTIKTDPLFSIQNNVHFTKTRHDWNKVKNNAFKQQDIGTKVRLINKQKLKEKKIKANKQNIPNYSRNIYKIHKTNNNTSLFSIKNLNTNEIIENVKPHDIILAKQEDSPRQIKIAKKTEKKYNKISKDLKIEKALKKADIDLENQIETRVINEDNKRISKRIQTNQILQKY